MDWDEAEHPRRPKGSEHGGEWVERVVDRLRPISHPQLWHVTPGEYAESIQRQGLRVGGGGNGAFFGRGIYLSTTREHADATLEGWRNFIDDSSVMLTARARVRRPFLVEVGDVGEVDVGSLMVAAMRREGIIGPTEYPQPAQITQKLRAAGYDSVEVRQAGPMNHYVGGSQLVVFDPDDVELTD